MDNIWMILGLEPTQDIAAIRQAYARKAKDCHPEEDQEGFLRLRQAYQAALDYAKGNSMSGSELPPKAEPEQKDEGWSVPDELPEVGENPFRGGEAIRNFETLYTGKQRKNPKMWMDYFTSDPFLDVAWDSRFTALLLETVTRAEPDLRPNKEFAQWLSIAYQVGVGWTEDRVPRPYISREGQFDGQESIFKIVVKGPVPKEPKNNEFAVLQSFLDYRHLVGLAEKGAWDAPALAEFRWIAGRYVSAYIKERCEQRVASDCERHPAGLRVFLHFFQRSDLPEAVYRIAWDTFNLKSAIMGRGKVLYGCLRELVMERVPSLGEEKSENFFQLNLERDACYERIKAHPEIEDTELDALFAQESLQKAMRSRQFMAKQLKPYYNWLNSFAPEGMLRRIGEFYRSHPEIPGGDQIADCAEQQMKERIENRQKEEAEKERLAADISPEDIDLSLLATVPERVYVQPVAGLEQLYRPKDWVDLGEEEEDEPEEGEEPEGEYEPEVLSDPEEKYDLRNAKPLSPEGLIDLFSQFTQKALERIELWFHTGVLVLTRSDKKCACFYFEYGYDTWYTMLSQPDVYRTVDCKDVIDAPFGMGRLESYVIHDSADSILRNLNLAFTQIDRGRPQVRVGDSWLWSTDTYQQNGHHKKRMAMQKLAGIPACRASDYILGKFVLKQFPSEVGRVSLEGERTKTVLRPGGYGLAANELVQFIQRKLTALRLTWTFKQPDGGTYQRHIVLLQDDGRFMMVWLRDDKQDARLYTYDEPRTFYGQVYPASPVHLDLARIRNCLDLLLDDMTCADQITDRPGQFIPVDHPYEQIRHALVDGKM